MMAFDVYASFYDAFYAEKDYAAEVAFVGDIFAAYGVRPGARVLDLGCGTGSHDILLARRGYEVTGIDCAPQMVARAVDKAAAAGVGVTLSVADARDADIGEVFDAVIAMFAVVSYQCSNADLAATLATARRHLAPGGLFVFDAWFGPAVLVQQPEERILTVDTPEGDTITRVARPTLNIVAQTVDVAYEVTRTRANAVTERAEERHRVRFLFARELAYFLDCAGFEMLALGPFMDLGRAPTAEDWNVSVVARAV